MGRGLLTTLIVAAHPDDEILGAGIWIHRHSRSPIAIVHITDGSPRDMQDARALGFSSRRSYAAARRRELAEALRIAAIPPENCVQFHFADKEAYLNLPSLVEEIDALIAAVRPDRVFSPAYEGGHPDHDAAAFAVAMVRQRMVRQRRPSFQHWEFPLYHANARGRMVTGQFIRQANARSETVISLSPDERSLKSQMLACFTTQQEMLSHFKIDCERFRRARAYDFTKPPHPNRLLYERWGWGIGGADWRQRAAQALPIQQV